MTCRPSRTSEGHRNCRGSTNERNCAVVGSSCRLPGGASTPSKLWNLLKEPRDLLVEVPTSRFNVKSFFHPDGEHHGVSCSPWQGLYFDYIQCVLYGSP